MCALVSAVVTTYMRAPQMVIRAIESILAQTYRNIEIIVVDDSPNTFEQRAEVKRAVESMGKGIKYIMHESNQGACAARNTGIGVAQGTFVAFLDDDDEWMPDKLELQVKACDRDDVAIVYCGRMTVNDLADTKTVDKVKYLQGEIFDELIMGNFIGSTSIPLLRKSCLVQIGGFDPLMKSAQDYDVWLRLAEKYQVRFVAEPLVAYHVHAGERISTRPQNKIDGQERIIEKNRKYISTHAKAYWIRHIKLATQYAANRNIKKALSLWFDASSKCPMEIKSNMWYFAKIIQNYMHSK